MKRYCPSVVKSYRGLGGYLCTSWSKHRHVREVGTYFYDIAVLFASHISAFIDKDITLGVWHSVVLHT